VSDGELAAALAAEAEGRYLESFSMTHRVLAQSPEDPDALTLLGRLCAAGGDLASAIALHRLALRLAPAHDRARRDLAAALAAVPDRAGGRAAYDAAIAIEPELAIHHRIPSTLGPFERIGEARAALETAINADPGLGAAHAALANLLAREGRGFDALAAYRRATGVDPDDADAHLAAAEIAHTLGDDAVAAPHLRAALALRRRYEEPAAPGAIRVVALFAPVPWTSHAPLDLIADRRRVALIRLYLDGDDAAVPPLPDYDIVFTAMSESEGARAAIEAAARFVASQPAPVVNRPQNLARLARPALPGVLAGVPGCLAPQAQRCDAERLHATAPSAADVAGLPFPLVIRPVDAHGGKGLVRLDDAGDLHAYLVNAVAARFDLARYVDCRGADGWYRKYRVIVIDGRPYPYHLAFADDWMVHYERGATRDHRWMQEEEAAFVRDPQRVFPDWEATFTAIAAAVGLDYVGFDCARTAGGEVLVFEADPASWVHAHDAAQAPHRARAVAAIGDALATMLERRAAR
jgi:tetratricopeptide (TPR) repeat protein